MGKASIDTSLRKNEKYSRMEDLDVTKGIGILLVVIGHAISALEKVPKYIDILNSYIYLIHMPIFFIVGGLLFQRALPRYEKKGTLNFVKKKAVLYMVPYCFFSLTMYIVVFLASNVNSL